MFKRKMLLFSLGVVAMVALVLVLTMPATEETPAETANTFDTDEHTVFRLDPIPEMDSSSWSMNLEEECTTWRLSDPPQCAYLYDEGGMILLTPQPPSED